ncbi:MAG: hypothetical protein ACR65R_11495 [Methylomicrobium sp.]
MIKELQPIFSHLASDRPSFLFLGQDYLKLDNGIDPLLTSISSKYLPQNSSEKSSVESYKVLLEQTEFADEHSARAWISEASRRLVEPKWLEIVSKMPWSGVYSSAIDTQLTRAFRTDWRDVQPIFSKKFFSPDPRSRTNLHITYLFGCIEREEEDERAPLNEIDLIRRSSDATILLSRLSEQVTPFGMLFLEGYQPKNDWLGSRELATVLLALEKGQVHFFSATDLLQSDPLIKRLVNSGQVVLHAQSLASVLNEGYSSGVLSFDVRKELQKEGHFLSLGDKEIEVPNQLWIQTNRSAIILEDAKLECAKIQSDEGRYIAFRNFLADSGTKPVWGAYAAGFSLERDYESDLFHLVQSRLRTKGAGNDPIILHGQTGTGKSVALGALAYRIRSEKKYAVLFIERRPQGPIASDLDQFCKWADDTGFAATVIIWDGMVHIDQYTALLKNLLGRGRNVIVVGSTYKLEMHDADQRFLILAPSNLSDIEAERFKDLMSQFEPSLGDRFEEILQKKDTTFLVALYRLLPETRGQVKYGLQRETSAAELMLKQKAGQLEPEFVGGTLAAAFQKAGILSKFEVLPEGKKEVGREIFSPTEELVGLIMVPGRFGLKVPIELVIRTLGHSRIANFHKIFESVDIFRWYADSQGNIFIGARHPLEAKLICQLRLGGPRLEIEFAKKLLIEIDESEDRIENSQIQFATDLLRNLGPNGPEQKLYSSYYEDIASCLAKLRLERGVENPRIMLQEASLLREAVVATQVVETAIDKRLSLLNRATDILKNALTTLPSDSRARRLRSMLLVELASTFGTKVRELLREGSDSSDVMDNFNEARRYAYQARTFQPEDLFSIDVISWSTKEILIGARIDDASRLDVIVDLLSMFESCDQESMSMRDKEIFNRRRAEFGNLLQDETLKQDALDKLEAIGSRAGYYLNALMIAKEEVGSALITPTVLKCISAAVEYLQNNYTNIESDGRCLFLLLRYWWLMKTQKPIFGGERQLLPFNSKDWTYVISLLDRLMSLDEIYQTPMNRYLRAIGTWSLGYYHDANEIWKDLQRISDSVTGRRRIAKSYVSSNPDGTATLFSGTVDWVAEDGAKGQVFVEGIREKINFFPRDFGLGDLRKGQALNNFCIAFNYIGPVADPSYHSKS